MPLLAPAFAAAVAHPILDIAVAPDDKWLAVSNGTDNVWIYSIADGKLLRTLRHKPGSHLVDLEISPDGRRMVCTNRSYSGDVTPIWDTKTWKECGRIAAWISKGFADPSNGIEYAGNGRFLVGQRLYGGEVVCWDANTGSIAYELRKIVQGGWYALAVNPRSTLVAINNPAEPGMRFWDFEASPRLKQWGTTVHDVVGSKLQMMRFSRKGGRLFMGFTHAKDTLDLAVYQPHGGRTELAAHSRIDHFELRDMDWSGGDDAIYLAGLHGQIVVWDPKKGRLVLNWIGHGGAPIKALAACRTGIFATGAEDKVCIWEAKSGNLIRTLRLPSLQ